MAKSLPWYKREPEKALAGMKNLTPEERGIYNTVLDLIYFHGDDLADDDRHIAGWCNCDLRVYRRVKARLIVLEKLFTADGRLRNDKASMVVAKAIATGIANRNAAIIKWHKSEGVSNNTNGLADAPAHATAYAPAMPSLDNKIRKKEEDGRPPKDTLFGLNLDWLKATAGKSDGHCRKFIGRLIRDYGEDATLNALRAARARADPPVNPFGYISSILEKAALDGPRTRPGDTRVQQQRPSADLVGISAALAGRSLRTRR